MRALEKNEQTLSAAIAKRVGMKARTVAKIFTALSGEGYYLKQYGDKGPDELRPTGNFARDFTAALEKATGLSSEVVRSILVSLRASGYSIKRDKDVPQYPSDERMGALRKSLAEHRPDLAVPGAASAHPDASPKANGGIPDPRSNYGAFIMWCSNRGYDVPDWSRAFACGDDHPTIGKGGKWQQGDHVYENGKWRPGFISRDRVRFRISMFRIYLPPMHGQGGKIDMQHIALLTECFGLTRPQIDLTPKVHVGGTPFLEVLCRPSQFARYIVKRNQAGMPNMVKELDAKLEPGVEGSTSFIDVSQNRA